MTTSHTPLFLERAEQLRREIDAALDRYSRFDDECPERLREAIRYSLLAPGKRLRPLLTLMAAEACGNDYRPAMPVACAVEMIHCYSLIHDDLPAMDDDDLRRGRPTCHVVYGEALAILAGDALLARAFEIVAGELQWPERAALCCKVLAAAAGASALVGGQADDLAAQDAGEASRNRERLEAIHRRKTEAMLTVSLEAGAYAVGGASEQIDRLVRYGRELGLAFQITDDLLDAQGDEQTVGKRTGKDASRGKLTFPGLLGIEESRRRAAALVESACEIIKPLGPRAEPLMGLARYVLERKQ